MGTEDEAWASSASERQQFLRQRIDPKWSKNLTAPCALVHKEQSSRDTQWVGPSLLDDEAPFNYTTKQMQPAGSLVLIKTWTTTTAVDNQLKQ